MTLLPSETVQFVSEKGHRLLLERLGHRTRERGFFPSHRSSPEPRFEGRFDGAEFELRLLSDTVYGPNPVVKGSIRQWEDGSTIDARVSLSRLYLAEVGVAAITWIGLIGLGGSLLAQGALALVVGGLGVYNRLAVSKVASAFRREMSVVAEQHDTYPGA